MLTTRSGVTLSVLLGVALSLYAGTALYASEQGQCADVDADALQWLDRMSRSIREESYHGVVTLQRDDDLKVVQISHAVESGNVSEHLTALTGRGARVERAAHSVDCIHPGDQLLRLGSLSDTDECGIAEHYRLRLADGERVAGRDAVRLIVEPRDMYRFGYVMVLDRKTGLLLKLQTVDHGEKVLETMQFAQISYSESIPAVDGVEVRHKARHPSVADKTAGMSVSRPWTVGWLPKGFSATDASLGSSGRRTYTDGLAVFSVFLEELDREIRPGEGLVKNGGTTTYTRGMRLTGSPVLVTVIGDVPENTARMVADAVAWDQ